ncbi:helix-turn-helix domain-containing protein [Streptomyces coeruleorubidus]|uniref:helix-turn-helix domain-containing protein n=1 Tax=Streptomyces coeruleorubidus TaxID=116188 RepID=UPI0033B04728
MARSTGRWFRLTTTELPEGERLQQWETRFSRTVTPLRWRKLQPRFDASLTLAESGCLGLGRGTGSAHIVERDSELIRAVRSEYVKATVPLRGRIAFYTGDGAWALRPGQALIHDSDQVFSLGSTQGMTEVAVIVPRAVYEDAVGPIDRAVPQVINPDGTAGAYIAALGRLLEAATRSEAAPKPDETAVLELLSALSTGGRATVSARTHYEAACEVIERSLYESALGAEYIAARIGISGRHLSRVFAAQGTTVPRYILGRRLVHAHRLITSPEGGALTVAETAQRCGFASPSHFSEKFAKRFGIRPAELRRQTRSASSATG